MEKGTFNKRMGILGPGKVFTKTNEESLQKGKKRKQKVFENCKAKMMGIYFKTCFHEYHMTNRKK